MSSGTMGMSSTAVVTTGAGATTTSSGTTSSSGSGGMTMTGAGGASSTGGTDGQTSAGMTNTGAGGTGGIMSGECTRELLSTSLDAYFAALESGDPSSLPLAPDLKFTENAQQSEIGSSGLWTNAGAVKHSQSALDTELCTVAAHAVIPEGNTDLPVAIRIKLDNGQMSEIETIVVRPGDYTAVFAVPSNPGAIISIADEIGWHDEVPEGQRNSRDELIAWIDKYFRLFPSGVCDVTGNCRRLENGGGNFSCSDGASCSSQDPGPNDANLNPRLILADVERGIAVGLTILSGHLDMHMVKMYGGNVYAVHAILGDTGGQSGWD